MISSIDIQKIDSDTILEMNFKINLTLQNRLFKIIFCSYILSFNYIFIVREISTLSTKHLQYKTKYMQVI